MPCYGQVSKNESDFTECVGGVSSFERWDEKSAAAVRSCFVIFPHVDHLIKSKNSATYYLWQRRGWLRRWWWLACWRVGVVGGGWGVGGCQAWGVGGQGGRGGRVGGRRGRQRVVRVGLF